MKKRVVIVTGAGKGIGKAIARAFAAKKYHVVVAEKNEKSGRETVDEILESGESALFLKTDVSKVEEVKSMVEKTQEAFGKIDVLVNNAGLSEFTNTLDLSENDWDTILDTNLKGAFFAAQNSAKYMQKDGGSIINIASTRALMSEPGSEAYAASKGGLLALTHALAASFAPYKIRVNAILPGWIENNRYEDLRKVDHEQHWSGRVGKPDDIARACLYLADKSNDFITGTQLVIDGGMTRKMIYE